MSEAELDNLVDEYHAREDERRREAERERAAADETADRVIARNHPERRSKPVNPR